MFTALGSYFGPWGTAVGAVADYVMADADRKAAENRQVDRQRELNRMSIQQERESILGRVDAAKAAGIHPLVAMGAQGLGGPVVSAGSPDSGYPYSSPVTRPAEPSDDQKRYDRAQADLAELNVEAARRRLATQPGNSGAPNQLTGDGAVVPGEATPHRVSHVKIEGQSLPPASMDVAHQTPGVAPGWDVVQVGSWRAGQGLTQPLRMVVPGGSVQRENWGEQMGELPIYLIPEVVRQSAAASGMSSKQWLYKMTTGLDPLPPRPQRSKDPVPMYRRGSRSVYGPVD